MGLNYGKGSEPDERLLAAAALYYTTKDKKRRQRVGTQPDF